MKKKMKPPVKKTKKTMSRLSVELLVILLAK
jgi:hypothetical protein